MKLAWPPHNGRGRSSLPAPQQQAVGYVLRGLPRRPDVFRNSGGKACARCEAHLVYRTAGKDVTRVTFAWTDDRGERRDARTIAAVGEEEAAWTLPTGKGVQTRWLEFEPVPRR